MAVRHPLGVALALVLTACPPPDLVQADAGEDLLGFIGEPVFLEARAFEDEFEVRYEWHLPDGTVLFGDFTSWTPTEPGRYVVVHEVHDPLGRMTSDTLVVRVGVQPALVPPRVSTRLAEVDDGVWVAAVPALDQVVEIVGTTTTAHPTCDEPIAVAVQGTRVAAACSTDQITRIQLTDDTSTTVDLPWGTRPQGLVWAGDEWRIAAHGPGQMQSLSEVDGSLIEAYPAPEAASLAITSGWNTVIGTRRSNQLVRVDLDTATATMADSTGPDSDTDSRGRPVMMEAMAVRADTNVVVLGGAKHNLERGETRDGQALTFETTSRATLRAHRPWTLEPVWSHSFDNRDRVTSIAYNDHGDLLFVGHGAGIVDVLDAGNRQRLGGWTGFGGPIDEIRHVGDELWVLVGVERLLYAMPLDDLVGTADEARATIDLTAGTPEPDAQRLLGEQIFHASGDLRMGRDGYLSCASCHPDGQDDGHTWDFTDRGEGLRNTRSLRDGLDGLLHWSGNFDELQDFEQDIRQHQGGQGFLTEGDWAGTTDALGPTKAGLSEELDALAAYIEDLAPLRSPHRESDGTMTADAVAGEAVFTAAGCASCHVPPAYTDSITDAADPVVHDVGTLNALSGDRAGEPLIGLDTPSLRGLFATAPYLHDGSATTLREVLTTANADDLHGTTSTLTPEELDQLEAFLLQLE